MIGTDGTTVVSTLKVVLLNPVSLSLQGYVVSDPSGCPPFSEQDMDTLIANANDVWNEQLCITFKKNAGLVRATLAWDAIYVGRGLTKPEEQKAYRESTDRNGQPQFPNGINFGQDGVFNDAEQMASYAYLKGKGILSKANLHVLFLAALDGKDGWSAAGWLSWLRASAGKDALLPSHEFGHCFGPLEGANLMDPDGNKRKKRISWSDAGQAYFGARNREKTTVP